MNNFRRLLFPFAYSYRKLELHARWWHRLALVVFAFLMLLSLGIAIFGTAEGVSKDSVSYEAASKLGFENHYHSWAASNIRFVYGAELNNGNLPMINSAGQHAVVFHDKVDLCLGNGWRADTLNVEIPEFGTVAFVNVSQQKASIKADELYRGYKASLHEAYAKVVFWSFVFLLSMFYGSQIVYRVIIYIAFGQPKSTSSSA